MPIGPTEGTHTTDVDLGGLWELAEQAADRIWAESPRPLNETITPAWPSLGNDHDPYGVADAWQGEESRTASWGDGSTAPKPQTTSSDECCSPTDLQAVSPTSPAATDESTTHAESASGGTKRPLPPLVDGEQTYHSRFIQPGMMFSGTQSYSPADHCALGLLAIAARHRHRLEVRAEVRAVRERAAQQVASAQDALSRIDEQRRRMNSPSIPNHNVRMRILRAPPAVEHDHDRPTTRRRFDLSETVQAAQERIRWAQMPALPPRAVQNPSLAAPPIPALPDIAPPALEDEKWMVRAMISQVDLSSGTLTGILEARAVPGCPQAVLTFFEGEIIDGHNHTLETKKWRTDRMTDMLYWARCAPFRHLQSLHSLQNLSERDMGPSLDTLDLHKDRYILMRWKERDYINVDVHDCTLTISGGYYLCLDRRTGALEGYYQDPASAPFQKLRLSPAGDTDSAGAVPKIPSLSYDVC
ncbi:uncharacterized protein L969DRAFT_93442 [Mixia osmundae IAM 14324]|uniref:Uncharacterized protein n=1 Tax=Mixia osmundae (strain CBS 9802 / IAM 14324 / JCM 22182 / KY 12970) TaxID=764103 RepID=G7DSB0_MIXOS|nr:uncharacterized protein L969DRAFT_93442 [Mixia osmundae IAM 14324]KEI40922.1 hypothetical protein L969DRAFT_93442 [Mixia osmundae IAM 14324]GAA93470.1 hypothetical protein E5Q_00111 [Mixia osmundae IAM 14324]